MGDTPAWQVVGLSLAVGIGLGAAVGTATNDMLFWVSVGAALGFATGSGIAGRD